MRHGGALALALALVIAIVSGCSSPTAPEDNATPAPAPPVALSFDGGAAFAAAGASAAALTAAGGGILGQSGDAESARPCSTFVHAAAQVGAWSIVAGSSLLVPVALTAAAAATTPSYSRTPGDGETYTWSVTRAVTDTAGSPRTYSATLAARIKAGAVHWTLRVSGQLPVGGGASVTLDDFLWYDGDMPLSATGGVWQFYDARTLSAATPAMRVNWTRAGTIAAGYLNQRADSAAGDSLRYALDGASLRFDMWTAATATRAVVVADTATWAGSLTRTPGDIACWAGAANGFVCTACTAAAPSYRRDSIRNSR